MQQAITRADDDHIYVAILRYYATMGFKDTNYVLMFLKRHFILLANVWSVRFRFLYTEDDLVFVEIGPKRFRK